MAEENDGDLDLEAAEYVLGTLDAGERATFAARLSADDTIRHAVERWERRFAPLVGQAAPVAPPVDLWPQIEQALGARAGKTLPFRVIQGGAAASAARDFRVSRDRWRAAAAACGVAALVLLGILFERPKTLPAQTYVAAVNRGGDKPALLVVVDLATRRVLVQTVAATPPPAAHSYELWYIGTDAVPQSMGVLKSGSARLTLPARAGADPTATFAVSLEAAGGSKTGSPTGAVLYSGQLVKE